jgi:hypothetical protein
MERGLNQNEIQYLVDHLAYLYKGPDLHDFLLTEEANLNNSEAGKLHIPVSTLPLSIENIITIEDTPVLFPCSTHPQWYSIESKSIRFHHDLLKSAFYLLSGYQEYGSDEKDQYGRYSWKSSIQYKLGISGKPVVNYYFEVILEAFGKLCMLNGLPFERPERVRPVLFLSHDVDRIKKYSFRNLAYTGLQVLRIKPDNDSIGFKRLFSNMVELLIGILFRLKDPYWNFSELKQTELKYKVSSTWFFLEKRNNMNSRYHFRHKIIRKLIKELSGAGDEIGLHGTLESSEEPGILADEHQRLQDVCEHPVYGTRQHFLKYQNPATSKIQSDTGLLYDATLGFAEQIGFRNSYAHPFKLYDFGEQKSMKLWQIPLNVMDATLIEYMNTPYPEISETIRPIINEVLRFKGVFSLLWHQCRLDEKVNPGINASYESLLEEIMALGFDSMCGEELIKSQKL